MTFNASETGWLLGGRSGLRAYGPMNWQDVNASFVAKLPLEATGFQSGEAEFVYRIGKKRASEPTLLVTLRQICIYRLDVNGTHRDGSKLHQFVTHIQRRPAFSAPESFYPNPTGVPTVQVGQRVTPQVYRAILAAFAAPIGMDILDVQWSDPPAGRQP
ncbi:hypothetical protein [Mycobacterium sp. Marseille-P9652]|uniref:hypothetical protein n=1 Tax=Mycobacterium sp. Marseille-P9652 TaxID=2654950 RepID=UPI0012E87BF4|nr:hypothetical protein [Mycobacterium sp. Marseille-P9652]